MQHMDSWEQMAYDVENAQQERFRKFKGNPEEFWKQVVEYAIFEQIKRFREYSKTYNPDNER